jgi:hypothetical protein
VKVPLKKIQLVIYAFFEVLPVINIEVANRIIFRFGIFSKLLYRFRRSASRRQAVMVAELQQDRATHFMGIVDRSIFISAYDDAGASLVDKII